MQRSKSNQFHTLTRLSANGDKDSIHNVIYLGSTECFQVFFFKISLQPLDLPLVYPLHKTVMHGSIFGGDNNWLCTDFEGPGTTRAGEWIRADNEMHVGCGVYCCEECRSHGGEQR